MMFGMVMDGLGLRVYHISNDILVFFKKKIVINAWFDRLIIFNPVMNHNP